MSYQEQHPNRKFKPSKENEDHDPSEFNRIMHEIAPKQIPSKFVDMIKIIRKDGKSRMDRLAYATEQNATSLNEGTLNPDWVSWLMGIPTGWESLKPMGREAYDDWFEDMTNGTWWHTERDLPRVATGKIDRVKRLKALGNGIVPASLALFLDQFKARI